MLPFSREDYYKMSRSVGSIRILFSSVMGVHQYRCDDSIICYDDYMVVMYI